MLDREGALLIGLYNKTDQDPQDTHSVHHTWANGELHHIDRTTRGCCLFRVSPCFRLARWLPPKGVPSWAHGALVIGVGHWMRGEMQRGAPSGNTGPASGLFFATQ